MKKAFMESVQPNSVILFLIVFCFGLAFCGSPAVAADLYDNPNLIEGGDDSPWNEKDDTPWVECADDHPWNETLGPATNAGPEDDGHWMARLWDWLTGGESRGDVQQQQ